MALPNGLAQVSDLGSLQGSLGYNIVDIPLMTATTAPGSPAAGTFHSSITNRAPMYDLRKDLSVNMGINRMLTQQLYQLQDEAGSNGEPIWGIVNDVYGQIRCAGNWLNWNDTNGQGVYSAAGGWLEITFYGTGLNWFCTPNGGQVPTVALYVDGALTSSSVFGSIALSSVLNGRNLSANTQLQVVSGLSLGVHTVRLVITATPSMYFNSNGFDILNEQFLTTTANTNSNNQLTSVANTTNLAVGMDIAGAGIPANTTISSIAGSTITMSANATATAVGVTVKFGNNFIKVNPGTSWKSGQKLYNPTQHLSAYNSEFESGTLGTTGGRVAVYQKADGSIAKSVTPTGSRLDLAATNHSNEEIVRTYWYREFGSGMANDFSIRLMNTNNGFASFTLNDGSAILTTSSFYPTSGGIGEGIGVDLSGDHVDFTFTGTGLDVFQTFPISSFSCNDSITIDGVVTGTGSNGSLWKQGITKIVSGLPYGTHTFRYAKTSGGSGAAFSKFIVYQPKTPTLPAGAQQIGSYNIVANYSVAGAEGPYTVSQGVIRKAMTREMAYVGAWTFPAVLDYAPSGFEVFTTTVSNYVEYKFWGTGFNYRMNSEANQTQTVSLNGSSNFTGITNSFIHAGATWTPAAGTITGNGGVGGILSVSGLPLQLHTVRITLTASSGGGLYIDALDIVTPIHSYKDNGPFVLQNTLAIGSQSVSDNRKLPSQVNSRNMSQAVGISQGPFITSTAYVYTPVPDLSVPIKTTTGKIRITFSATAQQTGAGEAVFFWAFVNGYAIGKAIQSASPTSGSQQASAGIYVLNPGPGTHKIDIYWASTTAAQRTANNDTRMIVVEEID